MKDRIEKTRKAIQSKAAKSPVEQSQKEKMLEIIDHLYSRYLWTTLTIMGNDLVSPRAKYDETADPTVMTAINAAMLTDAYQGKGYSKGDAIDKAYEFLRV